MTKQETVDFLPILKENLEAMKQAKAEDMKDIFDSDNPLDCVIEVYEDMIEIYKSRQGTQGDWRKCRCDNEFHWCFVHNKWGRKPESLAASREEGLKGAGTWVKFTKDDRPKNGKYLVRHSIENWRAFLWVSEMYEGLEYLHESPTSPTPGNSERMEKEAIGLRKRIAELEAEVKRLTVDPVVSNPASFEGTAD